MLAMYNDKMIVLLLRFMMMMMTVIMKGLVSVMT